MCGLKMIKANFGGEIQTNLTFQEIVLHLYPNYIIIINEFLIWPHQEEKPSKRNNPFVVATVDTKFIIYTRWI